jgi:hypothetical protein
VTLDPLVVLPPPVARLLADVDGWFVIGGHAVRCFRPYRPSIDVDLGVADARSRKRIEAALSRSKRTEVLERGRDTTHLVVDGVDVSVFLLPRVSRFAEGRRLSVTGILATKLHAILDRGTRRDFFDLFVMLDEAKLGIAECIAATRAVYGAAVNESLLLRALAYFDDADAEPKLPGEGPRDWSTLKRFFREQAGRLVLPPRAKLAIAARTVDAPRRAATRVRASAARPAATRSGKKT